MPSPIPLYSPSIHSLLYCTEVSTLWTCVEKARNFTLVASTTSFGSVSSHDTGTSASACVYTCVFLKSGGVFFLLPTLPREIVPPPKTGILPRRTISRQGGTISRESRGQPLLSLLHTKTAIPLQYEKLSPLFAVRDIVPPSLFPPWGTISRGSEGGTISRGRVGRLYMTYHGYVQQKTNKSGLPTGGTRGDHWSPWGKKKKIRGDQGGPACR